MTNMFQSAVGNGGTTYALDSTELFGMQLNGRFTISDGIRNEVLKRFQNVSTIPQGTRHRNEMIS